MSWWEWLIVSLVGYLLVGATAACIYSYSQGRGGFHVPRDDETALSVGLWPFLTVVGVIALFSKCHELAHQRGVSWKDRNEKKQRKKELRVQHREIDKIARDMGITERKQLTK